jgi:hypothetical protein
VKRKIAAKKGAANRKRPSNKRKAAARKGARRRQSPVARVKRVASGVVQQGIGLGERAVGTVTEFVQDRF